MKSFNDFIRELLTNIKHPFNNDLHIAEIRLLISKINEYLYTNYDGIGTTNALGQKFEYFSEFHKFWEKYHSEILNPIIDDDKCKIVADDLHNIFKQYGDRPFKELYDISPLTPEEACEIRYLTANQDFRGSRDMMELRKIYRDDPSIFDKVYISEKPEEFLNKLGLNRLSQNDKRITYAQTASKLLIDNKISAFQLLEFCGNDIEKVRNLLINNKGSGYGKKKTDMFLRDMVVLGIWKNPVNFEKIDVASDVNTIKVALRTGIVKTSIVLLSSFMDIFCYQYSLMDDRNTLAWRKVWEIWKNKYPHECIESPCLIDYLVYRVIGREFCKEALCYFKCNSIGHEFKWHSGRNQSCQICYKAKIKNRATLIKKGLPCMDSDGYIYISESAFTSGPEALLPGIKECPFVNACNPKSKTFRKFNPPKSISIMGQTGWETAYIRKDEGGGGLMA